jgi:hypothetical protein
MIGGLEEVRSIFVLDECHAWASGQHGQAAFLSCPGQPAPTGAGQGPAAIVPGLPPGLPNTAVLASLSSLIPWAILLVQVPVAALVWRRARRRAARSSR